MRALFSQRRHGQEVGAGRECGERLRAYEEGARGQPQVDPGRAVGVGCRTPGGPRALR